MPKYLSHRTYKGGHRPRKSPKIAGYQCSASDFFGFLGRPDRAETPPDRSGSSYCYFSIKNRPKRPHLDPFRGHFSFPTTGATCKRPVLSAVQAENGQTSAFLSRNSGRPPCAAHAQRASHNEKSTKWAWKRNTRCKLEVRSTHRFAPLLSNPIITPKPYIPLKRGSRREFLT